MAAFPKNSGVSSIDLGSRLGAGSAALAILAIALVIGGGLRFYRLGSEEMSRGEAAAWTAAIAPDLRSVYVESKRLDPGKSGIYDLALHLWIRAFGDQVGALRSFSAILGTLSILILFLAVREIFGGLDDGADRKVAALAAGFAALLFAVNLRMIETDRTARMYTLMLSAIFAQLWCFSLIHRRRNAWALGGAIVLTDLAVAANIIALFFFAAEALWLAYLAILITLGTRAPRLSIMRPAAALILAGVLFVPVGIADIQVATTAMHSGTWATIEPHPLGWPFRAIEAMTGNAAFWIMFALVAFAIWDLRRTSPLASGFVLFWLLLPFVILELLSRLVTPMMVERYVLPSLVAWMVLAGVGLAVLPNQWLRYAMTALVVAQSLAHIRHHWRAPEDTQWREAAQFAIQAAPSDQNVAVMPPHEPIMVMSYYLPPEQRDRLVSGDATLASESRIWMLRCGPQPVMVAASELPPQTLEQVARCYPRLLKRFRLVEVRSR